MKYPSVELYRTLHPSEPQWYDARFPVFALEPQDSYFIKWLSREQSGFRWRFKSFSNEIIIEILPTIRFLFAEESAQIWLIDWLETTTQWRSN
jgi:hypothetical protein